MADGEYKRLAPVGGRLLLTKKKGRGGWRPGAGRPRKQEGPPAPKPVKPVKHCKVCGVPFTGGRTNCPEHTRRKLLATRPSEKTFSCATCSKVVVVEGHGRLRKYCSEACYPPSPSHLKPRPIKPGEWDCATCGKAFIRTSHGPNGQKHCSDECRRAARRARSRPRPKCQQCGKLVDRKRRSGDPLKFCSRECSFAHWSLVGRGATPRFSRIYAKPCALCLRPFVSRTKRARCTAECDRRWGLIRALRSYVPVSCRECGITYCAMPGEYARSTCSDECRDAVIRRGRAAVRRAAKARRRAKVRSGERGQLVDPFRVFAECKWRCALCGCKTPQAKRGTYDDDAPELDHIVPLADGGRHVRANLQLTCRSCNARKGATARGQLWLGL